MFEKKKVRQEPHQLILMDWKMPEWDGVEVTRQFRERFKEDNVPIILTTYNWDEIMEEALNSGVDGFLSKPFFAKGVVKEYKDIMTQNRMKYRNQEKKASLSGRRVLLAEDMPINAEIMMQILKLKDIDADHAEDGQMVVDMFKESEENTYDAILMDVRMPILDGLQATKVIRGLDREDAASIPIIALTANAFDDDVRKSLDVGMNAHLSKPVEPDALFETLEKLIKD